MKELRYTLLDLPWEYRSRTCDFCSNYSENNGCANLIKTRHEMTNKLIAADVICKNCKEKFENDELPKCEKCGKLQTKTDLDLFSGKYTCNCREMAKEKELPNLPNQRESMTTFYERQINRLQEELATAEEALEIEREEIAKFQEKSEEWSKKQKQELLDKVKGLEERIKQLEEENRKLKDQQNGQIAQIEVKETKRWSWLKMRK